MRRFYCFVLAFPMSGCALLFPIVEDGGADGEVPDAAGEARVQDDTTIFCGPTLACSRADPNAVCCQASGDSGSPPGNYQWSCGTKPTCEAGASIACDQRDDCPPAQVCCWANVQYPVKTFCFDVDASNCSLELCDPNDAIPCINHPGYRCLPSGPGAPPGHNSPYGYFVCSP